MQSKDNKQKAYLFGPFIGELSWELYRFAPLMIYLKKENPNIKCIVLTRQKRFDLYGQWADIMIPLRLTDDDKLIQNCFKINDFDMNSYNMIKRYLVNKYEKEYEIVDTFTPVIMDYRYKLKWQFSRNKMCYDFKPRKINSDIINQIFNRDNYILIDEQCSDEIINLENVIYLKDLLYRIENNVDNLNSTVIGCLIEFIKKCSHIICNSKSEIYLLSLLLKKPVILINDSVTDDEIGLLNPFKVKVLKSQNVSQGLQLI